MYSEARTPHIFLSPDVHPPQPTIFLVLVCSSWCLLLLLSTLSMPPYMCACLPLSPLSSLHQCADENLCFLVSHCFLSANNKQSQYLPDASSNHVMPFFTSSPYKWTHHWVCLCVTPRACNCEICVEVYLTVVFGKGCEAEILDTLHDRHTHKLIFWIMVVLFMIYTW